ncbi:peptidylprolyl isomerase [Desulfogranum marinum]|jgi:FKBP-type peptidyl-prolyl cis-trans isomerase 2|uniref:FKBP-type peptidyl-prolyl cis-trans isomerase n=1 Tax=Desulfogranum marinum TaxID=453220 RepID=UPI001964D7DB|nr:FKBP-type peptidyl-prolyl cis-trans isomerase [Desulfogranum marinum]MBM9513671.1 FKBP-type peptidyl-prolyl cis-trans isomerase [Desulfogranum marinum]
MNVSEGKSVTVHYVLKLENGRVYESTLEEDPLVYTHGQGEIIKGMEKELTGMSIGQQKTFIVEPEEGYGEVTLDALLEVPREHVPMEARMVGEKITAVGPKGQKVEGFVYEDKRKTLVIDFNHPLAGMTLYFEVSVVDIQEPEPA